MPVRCYSQRILNPFRGVMDIISTGGADAVTIDGKNWVLYIHDNFDYSMDDPAEFFEIDMPDIRFGEWNATTGLKHSPLIASYHYDAIQAIGHVLLRAVEKYATDIPFAFHDNYELWLLDANNHEPLALLDSVCNKQDLYTPANIRWEAGYRCHNQFSSNIELFHPNVSSHAELLSEIINQRAGQQPLAQWFYRNKMHDGIGLQGINIDRRLYGRQLSPRLFPKMLVAREWDKAEEKSLVCAFLNWLSPCLLLLDFLRDPQRAELERLARHNAPLVERMYPLYPKIIDRKSMNAARVEAILRKANSIPEKAECVVSPTDYPETQYSYY